MKRSIVLGMVRSALIASVLLVSACASLQVRCDRHLVPINVHHPKSDSRTSK